MEIKSSLLLLVIALGLSSVACNPTHKDSASQTTTDSTNQLPTEYVLENGLIKNRQDSRDYQHVLLDNQMSVVLVSDPNLTMTSAALTVGVGSYQDPDDFLGLAHYLEHMIYQSSVKYPDENELMRYIERNAGFSNAFTKLESTTYLFETTPQAFDGALDRLAAAIAQPLFDPEFSAREIKAVHSEWARLNNEPAYQFIRANELTANPLHPYSRFKVGNAQTLQDGQPSSLNQALWDFYNKYYSANLMTLVLVAPLPIDAMAEKAKRYFSQVKNNNATVEKIAVDAFNSQQTKLQLNVEASSEQKKLLLQFPIDYELADKYTRAAEFIVQQLNRRDPATYLGWLAEKGYIQDGQCAFSGFVYQLQSDLQCELVLTDLGATQSDKLVQPFFQFIQVIKEEGLTQDYIDEFAYVRKVERENHQRQNAMHTAVLLSEALQVVPVKDILVEAQMYTGYSKQTVQKVLAQLTMENLRLWNIGQHVVGDKPISFAKNNFSYKSLNTSQYTSTSVSSAFALPKANVPEVETSSSQAIDATQRITRISRLINERGVTASMVQSKAFPDEEKGFTAAYIAAPETVVSAKNLVMNHLINDMFRDASVMNVAKAKLFSGVSLFAHGNLNGHTYITLDGNVAKHSKLLNTLLEKFTELEIDQDTLANKIQAYVDSLGNVTSQQPLQQASEELKIAFQQQPVFFSIEEKLKVLNELTLAEVHAYHKLLIESQLQILTLGNIAPAEFKQLAHSARTALGETVQQQTWQLQSAFEPQQGAFTNRTKSVAANDVAIVLGYIHPNHSFAVQANLMVLNQFLHPAMFNTLRSERQLGYVVQSVAADLHKYPTQLFMIQSDKTDLPGVYTEVQSFVRDFASDLASMTNQQVAESSAALIQLLEQKPIDVFAEYRDHIVPWMNGNTDFSEKEKLLAALKVVDKQSLLKTYQNLLADSEVERFAIQVKGSNFAKTEFVSFSKIDKDQQVVKH